MEELISRVFAARDIAHREHLRTGSYAQHMALNDFYDGVIPLIDSVAEVYQGAFGNLASFEVKTDPVDDVAEYLAEEADWIEANRDIISGGHNAVANLIDGVTALYLATVYKLQMLK